MKKTVMLLGCILMLLVSSAFAQDEVPIYINDVLLENSPPVLDFSEYRLASDSTPRYEAKLPLRAVFEGIGATVEWIPKNGNIRISMGDKDILCMPSGNKIYAKNQRTGKAIYLDSIDCYGECQKIAGSIYIDYSSTITLLNQFKYTMRIADGESIYIYSYIKGQTIVNGRSIKDPVTFFTEGQAYIPVRAVFGALGAVITWIKETGYTRIKYKGHSYLLEIRKPDGITAVQEEFLFIKDENTGEYLTLGEMSPTNFFSNIDGHLYLYRKTVENLINMWGYDMNTDEDNHIINISRKKY